ncbi:MAG: AsnC family transcriptional regulator [Gammaproteobacteria bacterium]|nr:AsnC family transcriptional regulator [Gammaproteobacteria bacterium]
MNLPAMKRQMPHGDQVIDETDRRIIIATQAGLPVTKRPYHDLALQLGLEANEVMARMQKMIQDGVIRRIGVVPNHYALGYTANAMSVWDVPDEKITELGERVGQLDFVSHCYQRPRHLPSWPFNLFAMVHGKSTAAVEEKIREIENVLGEDNRGNALLYSKRILKKTGLRLT